MSAEYWTNLRAEHHEIHGICFVVPSPDEHFDARIRHWAKWWDGFYQDTLRALGPQPIDLYVICLDPPETYACEYTYEGFLERGIRLFYLRSEEESVRFLKTIMVDIPLAPESPRSSLDQDSASVSDMDKYELLGPKKTKLSALHEALAVAGFEMRALLQEKYSATTKQNRAVEESLARTTERIRLLGLALAEKESKLDYLSTPDEFEIIGEASEKVYLRTLNFDIQAGFPIRKFYIEFPGLREKWEFIDPPTIDFDDPMHFTSKLKITETLPPTKPRSRRGIGARDDGLSEVVIHFFGYRHEIHEEEIRNLKLQVQQTKEELQYVGGLLKGLTEQHVKLCREIGTQQDLLSVCREDIGKLRHSDELDWDFTRVRRYLLRSSFCGISSEYGLRSYIPKNIAPVNPQIASMITMGSTVSEELFDKSQQLLTSSMRDLIPRIKTYGNSIGIPFSSIISTGAIRRDFGISDMFTDTSSEDEDSEDEWLKTRPNLRPDPQNLREDDQPNFNTQTKQGKKYNEEYSNLLKKAFDIKSNLKSRWATSRELGTAFQRRISEGHAKFSEDMEGLDYPKMWQMFLLDTEDFKGDKAASQSDSGGYIEIGAYANILQHESSLEAIHEVCSTNKV
ncbi:hypothetical protein TWF718_010223 [Orbilia javanica]|uniref:Uncharacterized protein n=1 Tax=Orbilia javanica TaxID=47235 RepID=A0AAN8MLL1_9PEZI